MTSWIGTKIKDDDIISFGYNEFSSLKKVGKGAYGSVNRAYWESGGTVVALKILANNPSINEENMNNFLKELKILRKVNCHENINRFFGITQEPSSNNYIMVLEYANQGNLSEYLKNNFNSLKWNDKIRMALDISRGLKYLHSRKIIHRDLYSRNILVHNGRLMIADLGLSKQLTVEATASSKVYGTPAYVEPQYFKSDNYIRDEKSDIYSLGVLLWEITSGYSPFQGISPLTVVYKVTHGIREQPVIETPSDYVYLYQKCWDDDPNLRPTIDNVFNTLENFSLQFNTADNKSSEINSNLDNQNDSQPQSSRLTITDNIHELRLPDEISTKDESEFYQFAALKWYNKIYQKNSAVTDTNTDELKSALDEIIQTYLKRNRIGWTNSFYFDKVLKNYEPKSQGIFNYLISNPIIQYYEVMLGKFYDEGFGINKNNNIAFEWYMKASQHGDINGHFEVGFYYELYIQNYEESSKFYQLAANKGLNIALHYLARLYNSGEGIQKNNIKAFELYKTSAGYGFIPSQHYLANCYEFGEGTRKNEIEASKWYKLFRESGGIIDPDTHDANVIVVNKNKVTDKLKIKTVRNFFMKMKKN